MGFRYLCQNIGDVKIIIAGVVSPFRLQDVYRAANNKSLYILNQSAYVQSRRGMLSATRQSCMEFTFDELFEKNLIYYNNLYETMSNSQVIQEVTKWDSDKLKNFYFTYNNEKEKLQEYREPDLIYSIVQRRIRKKKIKV